MATPLPFSRFRPASDRPGRRIVLVHGVGLGAETLAEPARLLSGDHDVVVPDRRGYGAAATWPSASGLDDQLDDLLAVLDDLGWDTADMVGVSGGATIGVAFAAHHPERLSALLVHEPLVGPLAADLDAAVQDRYAGLVEDDAPAAASAFVADLVGLRTWNHLPATWREAVAERHLTVRHEIAHFAEFAIDAEALAPWRALTRPCVSSLGALSAPMRHRAAEVAAALLGAVVRIIDGAGHLASVDNPAAFTALLRSELGAGTARNGAVPAPGTEDVAARILEMPCP